MVNNHSSKRVPETHEQRTLENAFNRIELVVLIGGLTLALAVNLPAVISRARSQQLACASNLAQIGYVYQTWANDHDDKLPMLLPPLQGGTQVTIANANTPTWWQFAFLSNELRTPKILACPSDSKRAAQDFSANSQGGLLHANFRNSAISYFLGHVPPELPRGILAGDRNIRVSEPTVTCSFFGNLTANINLSLAPSTIQWTNGLHNSAGNMLLLDGRVEQLSNQDLPAFFMQPVDDNGSLHLLMP
jgi:prepilin-type processing-associated H-X9-DG protein